MRTLKNSRKILSFLLLGMFFISLLIPFDISNTTSPIKTQESLTQDNIISEQKSPIQDYNPPKPSTPDSASRYNQTFSISQSADDAFGDTWFYDFPLTYCDETNITLGRFDWGGTGEEILNSTGIALRWNITVPKYATITKAYINLTIANLTFFGVPWTGFNTTIRAFNQPSTNDFSKPNEPLFLREYIGDLPWELNDTEDIDQTLQTINIASLLQQIMDLDDWEGIFGAWIIPGKGTEYNEAIQFWSYDFGNPQYFPKLFIEWENIPRFIEIPEDKYFFENAAGYPLKWQVWDDKPDAFKIECNESSIPGYIGKWEEGWVTYHLPALDRGFYNFTVYFNDTDGHLIWDSVIIEAGPPIPIISSGIYKIDRLQDDAWYLPWKGAAITNIGDLILGGSDVKESLDQRVICLRFNTNVPKHARITRAYVNLTVKTPGEYYDGFTSQIHMFYPPVADFTDNDDNDLFTLTEKGSFFYTWMRFYRPWSENSVDLVLDGTEVKYDIIRTPELNSNLQEIIDFGSYNGYIGLYIIPTDDVGGINDYLNIYAFQNQYPHYIPTLFVEWEESPRFVNTPADVTANNGTRGYHLDWTPADDNPTTFNITCNETVSNIPPGSTIYSGVWQSGVENFYDWVHVEMGTSITKIRYDLPPLDIGVYNFTIRINDADSWYNLDSVIVKVTDLDLPVIDVKFFQKGKEVDYFQCGDGPFSVRIYNSSVITPGVRLSAYYPGYNQLFYTDTVFHTFDNDHYLFIEVYIVGDTIAPLGYDASYFSYSDVLGCYEFTPPSIGDNTQYEWELTVWTETNTGYSARQNVFKTINDIEYNVLNRFEIRINDGAEYIYNQKIYGGNRWARPIKYVWNKDLTPPTHSEPVFIEPEEPDKHYEVNIGVDIEKGGAEIDDVFLYYSINDGPYEEVKMIFKDGFYYAEIPAQEEGSTIDYYIKITDIAGNSIETDEYHEKAPTFEEPSIIIPIVGILLGILGSLSIVMIYRHKRKVALKKITSEKKIKKVKK